MAGRKIPGLGIEIFDAGNSLEDLNNTFRGEGITIARDRLRIQDETIEMTVKEDELEIISQLGQGACSKVFKVQHTRTGDFFALKQFNIYNREIRRQLEKELQILSGLNCDSLIDFYGAFYKDSSISVILQYMDRGSIEFLADVNVVVDDETMACITYQILWGLAYLHYDNQFHRDIKPGNVLLNTKGEVKLSDFGISSMLEYTDQLNTTSVGTVRYMSLQRLLGEKYNCSADVWSLCIMLIELWSKRYPFSGYCSSSIELSQVLEELIESGINQIIPQNCSHGMRIFLSHALDYAVKGNRDTRNLLAEEWFTQWGLDGPEQAQKGVKKWLRVVDKTRVSPSKEGRNVSPADAKSSPSSYRDVKNERPSYKKSYSDEDYYNDDFEVDDELDDNKHQRRK